MKTSVRIAGALIKIVSQIQIRSISARATYTETTERNSTIISAHIPQTLTHYIPL